MKYVRTGEAKNESSAGRSQPGPRIAQPRWWQQQTGRLVLRACPSGDKPDACEGCQLRALCRCAHEDWQKACRLESRFWAVIAICGVAVFLYCVL